MKIPFKVILLAGGVGARMKQPLPKQYLLLKDKPVICHSLETFLSLQEVKELVIVCEERYRSLFAPYEAHGNLSFAVPGERRQDSVYEGLKKLSLEQEDLVCIHDGARPFIAKQEICKVVEAAALTGAAALAVPLKSTIKQADREEFVLRTLPRESLWEVQTPQVIRSSLLLHGFAHALENNANVTDDVSLVELLGFPVKPVQGDEKNFKLTTREDLRYAQFLLEHAETRNALL